MDLHLRPSTPGLDQATEDGPPRKFFTGGRSTWGPLGVEGDTKLGVALKWKGAAQLSFRYHPPPTGKEKRNGSARFPPPTKNPSS